MEPFPFTGKVVNNSDKERIQEAQMKIPRKKNTKILTKSPETYITCILKTVIQFHR